MRYYKISFYKKFKIIIISIIFCSLIALVEKKYIGINIKKENKLNLKIKKIINNINIKKKEINSDSQKILNIFIDELTQNLEEEKQIINKINLLIDEENNKSSFLNFINKFKIYLKNIKLKNKIYELIDYLTFFENIEMINVLNKLNKILYSKETSDEILNAYNLINTDEKYYLLLKEEKNNKINYFIKNKKNIINSIENNYRKLLLKLLLIYKKRLNLYLNLYYLLIDIYSLGNIKLLNNIKNEYKNTFNIKYNLENKSLNDLFNIIINIINKNNKNFINENIYILNIIKKNINYFIEINKIKNLKNTFESELFKKKIIFIKFLGGKKIYNLITKKLN